jgi:hypothetical protein
MILCDDLVEIGACRGWENQYLDVEALADCELSFSNTLALLFA